MSITLSMPDSVSYIDDARIKLGQDIIVKEHMVIDSPIYNGYMHLLIRGDNYYGFYNPFNQILYICNHIDVSFLNVIAINMIYTYHSYDQRNLHEAIQRTITLAKLEKLRAMLELNNILLRNDKNTTYQLREMVRMQSECIDSVE